MFDSIKKILFVSRPISWINTAFPFAFTYIVLGGSIDAFFWTATLFFLIPYNVVMYGINDVYDYESDMKNPRKNSIEGALEAKSFHPVILKTSFVLLAVFVPILLYLNTKIAAQGILLLSIFFVIAYSLKGLRFKEKPAIDSITSSMHFMLPMAYGIATSGYLATNVWLYLVPLFLWGMASHAFGAVQDIIPDKKGGIGSIATIIGARQTVWLCIFLYMVASIVVALLGLDMAHYIVAFIGLGYVVNILPYWNVSEKDSAATNKAWRRFIWFNFATGAAVTIVTLHGVLVI